MNLKLEINDGELRHNCQGHQEGDWLVFTCSLCKDYERRINYKTGEMKTRAGENPEMLHIGTFQPEGLSWESKDPLSLN